MAVGVTVGVGLGVESVSFAYVVWSIFAGFRISRFQWLFVMGSVVWFQWFRIRLRSPLYHLPDHHFRHRKEYRSVQFDTVSGFSA